MKSVMKKKDFINQSAKIALFIFGENKKYSKDEKDKKTNNHGNIINVSVIKNRLKQGGEGCFEDGFYYRKRN